MPGRRADQRVFDLFSFAGYRSAMRSFRDQLAFSIGFAITRSRGLLRKILREHAPDEARHDLAARVLEHLEQSGYEVDEEQRALRQRPPAKPHG